MPKVGEWFTVEKQPLVRKRRKLKEPYKVLTKICYVYLISFARLSPDYLLPHPSWYVNNPEFS